PFRGQAAAAFRPAEGRTPVQLHIPTKKLAMINCRKSPNTPLFLDSFQKNSCKFPARSKN
ncbi:MAG: hypothetical protein LIO70_05100, partial [Clostridiales bacterium]|nr:hypothetical protein [Clostridiales bacterium]